MATSKKVTVVADASVIVKWFVDEEYTKQALALRQNYIDGRLDIACPDLMPYEVLNALRYNPEFGKDQVRVAARAIEGYQLLMYPVLGELASLCIENSFEYGISLYDSSYVSLSEYLDVTLYTADQKLVGKAGKSDRLRHISDMKT